MAATGDSLILKDFCYLVNPYFPPARMMEELKSNFDILVRQYPSGMRVNCLLAAKHSVFQEEHIVLGNGAAELIKGAAGGASGKSGRDPSDLRGVSEPVQ